MSKYGEALRHTIERSDISKNSSHNHGIINRNNLNLTLAKVESPGVEAIEKYLTAFGTTWHDWAKTLQKIEREGRQESTKSTAKPPLKKLEKHGQASYRTPSNW